MTHRQFVPTPRYQAKVTRTLAQSETNHPSIKPTISRLTTPTTKKKATKDLDPDDIQIIPIEELLGATNTLGEQDIEHRKLYLYGEVNSNICRELVEAILKINAIDEENEEEAQARVFEISQLILETVDDEETAKKIIAEYIEKATVPKREPIFLFISSPGGSIEDGMPLVDAIRLSSTPIITVNVGYWYSMALIIGMCGDCRISLPHSTFLLHDGAIQVENTTGKIFDQFKFFNRLHENLKKLTLEQTDMTSEKYDEVIRSEFYMFAEGAKELGFIDAIIGENEYPIEVIT